MKKTRQQASSPRKVNDNEMSMPTDYIVLIAIGVLGVASGLYLLAKAKKYRARKRNTDKQ